jgi:hypothetical protein
VAEKKPFLLRVDRSVLEQLQRWANDELRSVNGQIEFVLRDALRRAGRSVDETGRKTEDVRELPLSEESEDATQG